MPQAQDATSYVYQGLWTNWSKGKTYGATLTLSPTNAIILVSGLAIFVQFAGSQVWKLFQFAIHQFRATAEPRDGLYHQQQVILRNNTTDLNALWQLLRVAIAWRHQKATKSFRRSLALITWALVHFILFAAAGTFVSISLDVGDEVLSRSPFCGTFNETYYASLGSRELGMPNHLDVEYYAHSQTRYQQSQEYVQFCGELSALCNVLPKKQLRWQAKSQDSCPFDPSICLETSKTVSYDTGYLSSHSDFGLNAPEADRVLYRKTTSCTILRDSHFITDWKDIPASAESPGSPAKRVVDAYYGPNIVADRNATYSYSNWDQYLSLDQYYSDANTYGINVQLASAGDTTGELSQFRPIPQLNVSDADVMLVFLSFNKAYESAVNDPWFSAQKAGPFPPRNGVTTTNGTIFTRERPVTTLGCTERHQICTGTNSSSSTPTKCTPLMGWNQMSANPDGVVSLNLTARQDVTYGRVFQSAVDSMFFSVLRGLRQRDPPLLARRSIQGLVSLGLPDNQWQLETEYWHSLAMANLQRAVVGYGTGQFAAKTDYINITASPEQAWLCQNLIIRGTVYQSFSFLGLILLFVFGFVVIIAGMTVEDGVALWRKWPRPGSFRQNMWVMNDMLEMFRLACEGKGQGVWSHSSNNIPISGPGQAFSIDQVQRDQHLEISNSSTSSHDTSRTDPTAAASAWSTQRQQPFADYELSETLRIPYRSSYPPPGWGALPLPS
jgi:hypothetical protein